MLFNLLKRETWIGIPSDEQSCHGRRWFVHFNDLTTAQEVHYMLLSQVISWVCGLVRALKMRTRGYVHTLVLLLILHELCLFCSCNLSIPRTSLTRTIPPLRATSQYDTRSNSAYEEQVRRFRVCCSKAEAPLRQTTKGIRCTLHTFGFCAPFHRFCTPPYQYVYLPAYRTRCRWWSQCSATRSPVAVARSHEGAASKRAEIPLLFCLDLPRLPPVFL